jgi:hypothetical protein
MKTFSEFVMVQFGVHQLDWAWRRGGLTTAVSIPNGTRQTVTYTIPVFMI